tara:strand:- start:21 stop:242 length:222 start_codon:yes stop_codon:yes gene_type:complete
MYKMYSTNTSGITGLSINTSQFDYKEWRVQVQKDGVKHRKDFPYTDEGLDQAIGWLIETRHSLGIHDKHGMPA